MRKIIIILILFGFLLSTNKVMAGFPDDLPGPKVMPDSKLYFLKIWWEKIVIFFTFNAVNKAEKYKIFAEKRADEIKQMALEGKGDLAEKLKQTYRSYLNKAKEKLEQAIQKAIDKKKEQLKQELEKKIDEITEKIKQAINL